MATVAEEMNRTVAEAAEDVVVAVEAEDSADEDISTRVSPNTPATRGTIVTELITVASQSLYQG